MSNKKILFIVLAVITLVLIRIPYPVIAKNDYLVNANHPVFDCYFQTIEELQYWLDHDATDLLYYVACLDPDYIPDCNHVAMDLQMAALSDGKIINMQYFPRGVRIPGTRIYTREPHFIGSATVGNDFYLIEPRNDFTWKVCKLD